MKKIALILLMITLLTITGCKDNKKNLYLPEAKNDKVYTLEIIPNIIGMRKNQAKGYWVPLEICARFVEDSLYVPLEAVAKEFGYVMEMNSDGSVITLK